MRSVETCVLSLWLSCWICWDLAPTTVEGIAIQGQAKDVSALQDTNVTLHCDVTAHDDIDFVLWKKILNEDHDEVLIHNNHTTNRDKYGVDHPHGLVVIGLGTDDEGLYQCEINQIAARTTLHVLVPASKLILSKEPEEGWRREEGGGRGGGGGGRDYNLSCVALHARPPALLTWFMDTTDVTARATSYTSTVHADGYGDSQSVLHVPEEWVEQDPVFRCVAGVGDPSADQTAFLFLSGKGTAAEASLTTLLLLILLSCIHVAIH